LILSEAALILRAEVTSEKSGSGIGKEAYMVALRKDVKVGLTIGAIAVSVIGVYAGLSALAGERPAGDTARLNTTPIEMASKPGTGAATPTVGDSTSAPRVPAPNRTGQDVAKAPDSTAPALPNQPLGVPASGAAGDPWSVAFGSGNLPPAVTQQPTPGSKADAADDQKKTIEALQGKQTVATAGDGSGSMANGGTQRQMVGTTEMEITPNTPAGPEKSHTIEPGETFSSISNEYYGDPNYFSAIIAANPQVNPNKLKPGTVIKIPSLAKKQPKSDTTEAPAIGGTSTTAAFDPTKQYVVKSGDSLHKIASTLWNDSTMSAKLYDANKTLIGGDPTKIKIGMVLTLPTPPTEVAKK
jgi:nucleoid-associated protein YgaU